MQVFSWQDFFLGFFRGRFFRAKKNRLERDRSDNPYIYIHTHAHAPGDKFL